MRVIKLGIISVVVIFIVIFLLSLLIPSRVIVSRAMTVNASHETVRKNVTDIREWRRWNAFLQDSSLTNSTATEDQFTSDQLAFRITGVDSTTYKTVWEKKGQEPVNGGISVIPAGEATIVQLFFDFNVGWYPWDKFGSIIFDKQLGPPMEKSLDQLKKICENTN
jgi:hypothetical protein